MFSRWYKGHGCLLPFVLAYTLYNSVSNMGMYLNSADATSFTAAAITSIFSEPAFSLPGTVVERPVGGS